MECRIVMGLELVNEVPAFVYAAYSAHMSPHFVDSMDV